MSDFDRGMAYGQMIACASVAVVWGVFTLAGWDFSWSHGVAGVASVPLSRFAWEALR